MNRLTLLISTAVLILSIHSNAQQLRLGDNPYNMEKSAVLDLASNNQGLLLPRINDTTLINALAPPDGMLIYFVPAKQIYVRSNSTWKTFSIAGSGVTTINGNSGAITIDTTYISNFYIKVRGLFGASAPLSISNGQFSITQAGAGSNGYLSSADWNTFNNKIPSARSINTTAPLTGGGDLSADRTLSISANGISNSLLRQSAGLSVMGNATNATANIADISAANDGEVLRRSGTTLGFGTVATAGIANGAITYSKIQNISANNRLLGRAASGAGSVEEITLGSGLSLSGTTLNVSSIPNGSLANSTIALAIAGTGTDVTVSGSPASLGSSLTLNLPTASASARGLLSSSDWTIFNNKQAAGNYTVDPGANGLMARTALNTSVARTLTGSTNRITISNGDGVSGNPTVDISNSYGGQTSITTLGTITTGTWNGNAIQPGYGGTGNNSTQFSGPSGAVKTYTLPNANAMVLTDNAPVTIAQGGTGATTANMALNALLPAQAGNAGWALVTDGSNASWADPSVTNGNYIFSYSTLTRSPTSNNSWTDIQFNNDPILNGWTHSTSSNSQNFTCNQAGIYLVSFAALGATTSNGVEVGIRALLDGADVAASYQSINLQSNQPTQINNTFLISVTASQVIKFQMNANSTNGSIRPSTSAWSGTTKPAISITMVRIK